MLHFLFLLTDSRRNLTAFSISCCVAATSSPALRAANFSPATLKKDSFSGKAMTREPRLHAALPSLLLFPERAVFSSTPHQWAENWGLLIVDSQSWGAVSKLIPSLLPRKKKNFNRKSPKRTTKKKPSPSAAESVFAIAGPQLRQLCCSRAKEKQPLGKSQ